MAGIWRWAFGLASIVAAVAIAAGCGGGGSSVSAGSAGSSSREGGVEAKVTPGNGRHKRQESRERAIRNFRKAGKEFPSLGSLKAGRYVANAAERESASQSLEAFMVGRADGDWEAVCETLSAAMLETVEELVPSPEGCPEDLALATERRTIWDSRNTMTGPIDFLFVGGDSGYALYHGKRNADYLVQMSREGGVWKVSTLEAMGL
jgi:hypothetical protein